jgi:hypothetical protein
MAFFRNSSVNLLNLHYAINAIAMNGGAAFFGIYLLQSGISVPGVLLTVALILIGRFIVRPAVIGLAARHGLRRMLVAGVLLSAAHYPILAWVHGAGPVLAVVVVLAAAGDTLYWTTFHAYFALLGDNDQRGQQVGIREAIAAVVGVCAPVATGWLLVAYGPLAAFGATGVVAALGAVPLLWMPDVTVRRHVPGAFAVALPGFLLFVADGWFAAGYAIVWQIVLFVTVSHSYIAYGGAQAVAALAGALGGLTLGRHIDAGKGNRAVVVAIGFTALIVTLRAASMGHPALAILANAAGSLAGCLYIPTIMTAIYSLAKRAPCPLRFQVAAEGGWDTGGALGLLCAALATRMGLPLPGSILLSLAGVVAVGAMLRRYYRQGTVDSQHARLPHGGSEPGGALS